MDFLAVLDYEHLDNGVFLTSFARSLANRKKRGIIIHGDSEYTERIIQTGVMREDARIRAIKELNHRLVALFADEGISTIAVNGYQKSLVTTDGNQIHLQKSQINLLPKEPMLLLSNLAEDSRTGKPVPVSLPELARSITMNLDLTKITLFSIKEGADVIDQGFPKQIKPALTNQEFLDLHLPESFRNFEEDIEITVPSRF
ncbi:MAG: hypothetical protein JJU13_09460 [Balneolaceae bacterium]|nr:hypothetical protein [Balneolaceae bacterium]